MKFIYTHHARARINSRALSKTGVEDTIARPDKKFPTGEQEYKFIKQQGTRRYHVVAKYLPDQKAWLVISAWVRGEEDQPPIVWRIITAPFRFVAWLYRRLFSK